MKRPALVLAFVISWFAPPAAAQPPLYVTGNGDGTVEKIAPGGGSYTATVTTIVAPVGIAVTANGTQYVSDWDTSSIFKVTPTGTVSTFTTGFSGPSGMALDSAGNLYVADHDNGRVVKVSPTGVQTVWATGMTGPINVALDRTGTTLYISDFDAQVVYKVRTSAPAAPTLVASVTNPTGLAVQPDGTLLVGSYTTNSVRAISTGGAQSIYVQDPQIMSPYGVVLDPAGNLFISSWGNGEVLRVPVGGGTPTVYASGLNSPNFAAFPVPEPAGVLLACGMAGAAAAAWRRRRPRPATTA